MNKRACSCLILGHSIWLAASIGIGHPVEQETSGQVGIGTTGNIGTFSTGSTIGTGTGTQQQQGGSARIGGKTKQIEEKPSLFGQLFANRKVQAAGQKRTQAQEILNQPHVATWYTPVNREQRFTTVRTLYEQALTLFIQGYQELSLPLDAAQPFSYVTITLYDIINLYLDEMKRQQNDLNVAQANNEDITSRVQLFRRLVDDADQKVSTLQHSVTHGELIAAHYSLQRDQLLFTTYSLLITTLALHTKQPVAGPQALPDDYYATRAAQAASYFIELKKRERPDVRIPGYATIDDAKKVVYRSMASMYVARAFNALKTMQSTAPDMVLRQRIELAIQQFQQAVALYQQVPTDSEASKLLPIYQRFAEQLTHGLQLLVSVDKQSDLSQRVTLLHQAHDALLAGGADILASVVQRTALSIEADSLVAKAQKMHIDLPAVSSYGAALGNGRDGVVKIIGELMDSAHMYGSAATDYEQALSAIDMPDGTMLRQKATLMPLAQTVATTAAHALQLFADALGLLQQQQSSLSVVSNQVPTIINQAVTIADESDHRLQQMPELRTYVPLASSLSLYIQQSVVAAVLGAAAMLEQQTTEKQSALLYTYYMIAYGYRGVMTATMAQTVQSKLSGYDLLGKARTAYQTAVQEASWMSTVAAPISPAESKWREALDTAWTAYASWKVTGQFVGAKELYVMCCKEAATRYAQQKNLMIDSLPQGEIKAAVCWYRAYGVFILENSTSDAQTTLKTIQGLLSIFFAQATQLQQKAQTGALADRIAALTQLVTWQRVFASAMTESQGSIKELQQLGKLNLVPLLSITDTGVSDRTYTAPLASLTLVLPLSLQHTIANLYVEEAQKAKSHKEARNAYESAITLYTTLGDTAQVRSLQSAYSREKILAQAEIYGELVIPFGGNAIIFAGTSVYAAYFINVYVEQLPKTLLLPQPLVDFLSKLARTSSPQEQKQLQESAEGQAVLKSTLPILAQVIYLYNALTANNLLDQVAGVDLYALIAEGQKSKNELVQTFIDDAHTFGDKLAHALAGVTIGGTTITTKLALLAQKELFSLVYGNRLVTAIPEVTSAHPWDPTALAYYTQSAEKYKEGGSADESATMQRNMSISFLSHAYGIIKRAQFMRGLEPDEQLVKILASDEQEWQLLRTTKAKLVAQATVLSPALVEAIKRVQLYYGGALGDISDASIGDNDYSLLSAPLYEESADFLRGWLLGDPFSDSYQSFIAPINQSYLLAQGAYQQAQQGDKVRLVGNKIASLFELVGDACTHVGKFLPGIGYYHAGEKAYQNSANNDGLRRVRYKGVEAQFKGATKTFTAYYDQRATKSTQARDTLLDALIFYSSLSDTAQTLYTDVPTPSVQEQAKQDIMTYLEKNKNIYFSTDTQSTSTDLTQALTNLMLHEEQLNRFRASELANLFNDGFDYVARPLQDVKASSDDYTRAVAAVIQWSNMLSGGLSAYYIRYFLPEASAEDQLNDLLSAMKAEAHQIFAPAEQYVGSFGSL
jgi:hypothetical protein